MQQRTTEQKSAAEYAAEMELAALHQRQLRELARTHQHTGLVEEMQ